MAQPLLCHAAGQPTYEVREIRELDDGQLLDLGLRYESASYQDAVDYAFDYLQRNEPNALEVVKVERGSRETVLSYSDREASGVDKDLVGLWGFDVTKTWHGPEYASTATR